MEVFNQAINEITPMFLELCQNSQDLDILQSAVYGLGVIAIRMNKNDFKAVKTQFATAISNIIMHPEAYGEKRAVCTECAVGALGRMAMYQGEAGDKMSQEILMKFLQLLPLKHEAEEAQYVHYMLLNGVSNKNEMLVMDNPEIQSMLLKVVNDIKTIESSNPEMEILDDKGKLMLNQILNVA